MDINRLQREIHAASDSEIAQVLSAIALEMLTREDSATAKRDMAMREVYHAAHLYTSVAVSKLDPI